jgi:hypothetical protein
MFFDDAKKIATVMRGKRSAKGERELDPSPMKPEVVKNDDGEVDGRHVAMQDFMSAHSEGSPAKMAMALANFIDMHNAQGSEAGDIDPK